MEKRAQRKFKRPYLVVEKIFERVALVCSQSTIDNHCHSQPHPKNS
jgi:hypothetical protein